MHPELPTFVTEAKKKTFHVTVKSHGAISEAKVQELIVRVWTDLLYLSMGRNQPMMHLQEFGEASIRPGAPLTLSPLGY